MESQAKVVIIGGGVMGCSLAYHLCKEGWTDVMLIEKGELTSGSTWHAAGQITHSVSHYGLAKMAAYGTGLYARLEEETGQSTTWHGCGSLRVAYEDAEVDWLHYTLSVGRGLGHHDMEVVGPDRIKELHPYYNLDGIQCALYTPNDGHVDPAGASFAMAAGARQMGGKVVRQNRVTGLQRTKDGEWIVETEQGEVRAEIVVNAGGTYARQVGEWVGLDLPIANMLHHYLITEPVPEFQDLKTELPVVRDDRQVSGYIRMEQKSGLIGIYEKGETATVWDDGTPWDSENELFEADYDRIMPWLENSMERMPIFAELGIRRVVHGAITHPPDGLPLLGPTKVPGYWLCCGSQVGLAWGPGCGKYLAQWMVHGAADISMASFDGRRFGAKIDDKYRIAKAKEDYRFRHEIPFPHLDRPACRPSHSKTSPLYEKLKAKGAVYQDIFGWERPYWYAPDGMPQEHIHDFRRSALHDIIGNEVATMREAAGIADLTAFSKIEISGPGAEVFLSRVTSNRLPAKTGSITLTYLVAPNGRLEGEATLLRLGENSFYAVYAAAKEQSILDWFTHQRGNEDVAFENVSENYGVLMLAGPKARDILAHATQAPLDNSNFRWLTAQHISIAGVDQVRAMRVSYTGELGWELHVPMEGMEKVYDALSSVGGPMGLGHVGSATLNAVRMEKAYKSGHELTNEVTVAEAGVERFARKEGFQGAEVSLATPEKWQITLLQLEEPTGDQPDADPLGSESIWSNGSAVGSITSGGYGYAVGAWLGWAYVKPDHAAPGTALEVMTLGQKRKAVVLPDAPFDPENERPRA